MIVDLSLDLVATDLSVIHSDGTVTLIFAFQGSPGRLQVTLTPELSLDLKRKLYQEDTGFEAEYKTGKGKVLRSALIAGLTSLIAQATLKGLPISASLTPDALPFLGNDTLHAEGLALKKRIGVHDALLEGKQGKEAEDPSALIKGA